MFDPLTKTNPLSPPLAPISSYPKTKSPPSSDLPSSPDPARPTPDQEPPSQNVGGFGPGRMPPSRRSRGTLLLPSNHASPLFQGAPHPGPRALVAFPTRPGTGRGASQDYPRESTFLFGNVISKNQNTLFLLTDLFLPRPKNHLSTNQPSSQQTIASKQHQPPLSTKKLGSSPKRGPLGDAVADRQHIISSNPDQI